MEHATYASRLRYLDADDVDDSTVDFDGLDVRDRDGSKLGDIDGFIVDATSGRVYHLVVDSGGWFRSRRFLLPIGHATLDRDAGALLVDVPRDSLSRYPEFDERRFREFSDEDLRAFERRTADVCCADDALGDVSGAGAVYDSRRHFRQPSWWTSATYSRERLRPVEVGAYGSPVQEAFDREQVTARERDTEVVRDRRHGKDAEDTSPHFEGRAQPGDVLGLETGGETTSIGDTAEEEDERRRRAERSVRAEDEPRRSDR